MNDRNCLGLRCAGWIAMSLVVVASEMRPAEGADLVAFDAAWEYLHPFSEFDDPANEDGDFDSTWYRPDLDDSTGWNAPSPAPFAWPDEDVHINAFTPDHPNFVREANTFLERPDEGQRYSVYFRHNFTTFSRQSNLAFELLTDDGAAIYLDGEQVALFNCCDAVEPGDDPTFLDLATSTGNENSYAFLPILDGDALEPGEHSLAVQVVSASTSSSDMGFSLRLLSGFSRRPLIETGEEWRYFLGEEEPSDGTLDWTTAGFDDSAWDEAVEGFGYERDGVDGVLTDDLVQTVFEEMEGNFTSVYLRKRFEVENAGTLSRLNLGIDYDDGFVAYINGQQVAISFDDPDDDPSTGIPFDTFGQDIGLNHESTNGSGAPGESFEIDLTAYPGLLRTDGNVLAIHGLNRDPSSDFALAQLELVGLSGVGGVNTPGDYDGDGELTALDIDTLNAAIRSRSNDAIFDLTGDGQVNTEDRAFWVEQLKGTWFGDANLDGEFNSQDFVLVFTSGQFEDGIPENASWSDGDWNGDKDFTSSDFVIAFTSGGFEVGPRAASSVPEPGTYGLIIMGLTLLLRLRRQQ